jgi:hypothetical protein
MTLTLIYPTLSCTCQELPKSGMQLPSFTMQISHESQGDAAPQNTPSDGALEVAMRLKSGRRERASARGWPQQAHMQCTRS